LPVTLVHAVEVVIEADGKPLENAVVTVVDSDQSVGSTSFVQIEQRGQQFQPRITVVNPGSQIRFPNRDITQHHVYSFSDAKVFEIELYGGDEPEPVLFETPGIVALGCNIHDWMLGYVYVTPHSNFGVTDRSGKVDLNVGDPSLAEITVWHAGMEDGPIEARLTDIDSGSDGDMTVSVTLPDGDPLFYEVDPLQTLFGEN